MGEWEIISIVIGIAGALFGVYFRESLRSAKQKKLIAIRLEAHIHNFTSRVLESEFKELYLLGRAWYGKKLKAFTEGGLQSFIEADDEIKKKIEELEKKISEGIEDIDEGIKKLHTEFREMDDEIFRLSIQSQELIRDYLMDNKNFISEEDASKLSWAIASHVVEARNYLLEMSSLSILFATTLKKMESLNIDTAKNALIPIVRSYIRFSTHIEPLRIFASNIRKRSILALTFREMIGME